MKDWLSTTILLDAKDHRRRVRPTSQDDSGGTSRDGTATTIERDTRRDDRRNRPTIRDDEHAPSQADSPTTKGPGTKYLGNSHPTNQGDKTSPS